jgi:hypothetical protein
VTRFIEKYPRYNEKQTKNTLKSNRKIVERKKEAKLVSLTHKYMTPNTQIHDP